MNFEQSSTYSDEVGLKYLKAKFPNARIIEFNKVDKLAHFDFIVIDGNTFHLVETKIRYTYYDELIMEKMKYELMKNDLDILVNNKHHKGKFSIGNIYYLNVIGETGYLFNVDSTTKREGEVFTSKCTATDGYKGKVVKPVYFLKTTDAETITLTLNDYENFKVC